MQFTLLTKTIYNFIDIIIKTLNDYVIVKDYVIIKKHFKRNK